MEVQTFPPSPNWYLSDILCSGPDGLVIYGSRNTLVITVFDRTLFESSVFPKFQIIEYAHKERITTVRFCPDVKTKFGKCFASAGDDSLVKLWDLNTMTPIIANFAHGDGKKVVSMDWSSAGQNLIVSVDDHGAIVAWDLEKNTTCKINLAKLLQMKKSSAVKVNVGKLLPLVIKCCPHQKDLIAVGVKGGLVCLITIKDSGKVLHCMRGHDKDVTSLAWCPVPENVLAEKDDLDQNKSFMLASVCRDRCIFLWRALDGRFQRTMKLPNTSLGRHSRLPATATLLTLDWPSKTTILCNSNYGEILRCELSCGDKLSIDDDKITKSNDSNHSSSHWELVHDLHSRGVFAIHVAQYTKEGEDGEEKEMVVWTTAQDRHLVAVSLNDGRVLANIPTIGGFVYCMASSPFDPSRIAVGLGDFSIRIWNTGNTKEVQMSTMWQKIKGKVMAVAWHPTLEMKLAFGTHEGRVGIQDLIPGRLPIVFILRHRHSVYALSWGPPCYKEGESQNLPQFCLYSCGDGEILLYNPDDPEKEPKRMNSLMRGGEEETKKKENLCTDIAWKPDYSLLAVGNSDGTVQLFSAPYLKLVYTLYAHRKLLMTLTWHPISTSSDTGLSSMRHCLATGSNEHMIQVYDLSNLIKTVSGGGEFKSLIQSIATLMGHQKKVVRLSWSPHTSGQLCSASYDNTIRVWDVVHQTCTACFMGHLGAGLACMWSPMDPDIIISGSSDFTLCAWRISEAKFVPKPASSTTQRKKTPAIPPPTVDKVEKTNEGTDPNILMAKSAKDVESSKLPGLTWRGSLFPVSWKIAGGIGKVDGVRQLLEKETGNTLGMLNEPNTAKLGFYGDRDDMYRLLKKEEAHHLAQDNVEQAQLMGLWRGNIAEMLKDAIAKGMLSDWLVSIAPSASHKLWVEACQAYSEQLAKCGKYNQAAAYLLACHKVDEAIELLRSQMLFREALAIARCRLAPEDPTAHKLTMEWGRNLFLKGNYEVAAMCFTSIGEYLDAARALASRSSLPDSVSLGATLALKAGAEGRDLALVLSMQCMHLNLLNSNWDAALECVNPVKELKPLSIVIELHRRLVDGYETYKGEGEEDLLCRWLRAGEKEASNGTVPSPLLHLSSLPWSDEGSLKADEAYSCISTRRAEKVMASGKNFMLELAEELALGVCAAYSEGEIQGKEWHHILKAMALCYSHQLLGSNVRDGAQHSLLQLCFLLFPNGPENIDLFDTSGCVTTKGYLQSARAFCVFAAAMWSEDKWVGDDCERPWSSLTSLLLSYLSDTLDPQAASYFKEEVDIHKREQELAKAKARLRTNMGSGSLVGTRKEVGSSSKSKGDALRRNEDDRVIDTEEACNTGNDGDCVVGTKEIVDLEESKVGETLEEIISEKESELVALKERRVAFEQTRISAPNPFVCLYKLRNVCDMIVNAQRDKENALSKDVLKLQDEIIRTMEISL